METTECPQCGNPVEQTGRGRPRRFCRDTTCADDYWNDQKPRKYNDQAGYNATRHMLTEIDHETMTATCSQCGPATRVWSAGGTGRVGCSNRFRKAQYKPAAVRSNRRSAWRRQGIDLTVETFDAMIDAQRGRCAACDDELSPAIGAIHVDHDHETGAVRGLTCRQCNRGMGVVNDDPVRLRQMADYLERNATTAARP